MWTPSAAILASDDGICRVFDLAGRARAPVPTRPKDADKLLAIGSVHTPVNPAIRLVRIPKSAQVRMRTSSSRRTYSIAPRLLRVPLVEGNTRRSKIG